MGKILNKVKEKKLKAIKSEISEISRLVSSNSENELDDNNISDHQKSDTITLTKIVDNVSNYTKREQLIEIIEEIRNVKVVLSKQDKILEDILLKLSKNN